MALPTPRGEYRRRTHPGQAITPLLLVSRDGSLDLRCLHCERPVYVDLHGGRHHYRRRWSGRRARVAT